MLSESRWKESQDAIVMTKNCLKFSQSKGNNTEALLISTIYVTIPKRGWLLLLLLLLLLFYCSYIYLHVYTLFLPPPSLHLWTEPVLTYCSL
jgi:hypothetical protein